MFYINNDITSITRYDMSKFMDFDTDSYCILDSYFCSQLKNIPYSGAITIKTQVERPDLLAYDIYGDVQYWWILMLYNDLQSPKELVQGLTISYPSLTDLENLYFTLSTRQKTKDSEQ